MKNKLRQKLLSTALDLFYMEFNISPRTFELDEFLENYPDGATVFHMIEDDIKNVSLVDLDTVSGTEALQMVLKELSGVLSYELAHAKYHELLKDKLKEKESEYESISKLLSISVENLEHYVISYKKEGKYVFPTDVLTTLARIVL